MIEQLLRTERARLQGEIDLIDRMLAQIPQTDTPKTETPQKETQADTETRQRGDAAKRRADLLECATEIGRIFEVKELRKAYEGRAGKSDKITAFVQNSIVAFCGSGVMRPVNCKDKVRRYGLKEWFDLSGVLKPQYEKHSI